MGLGLPNLCSIRVASVFSRSVGLRRTGIDEIAKEKLTILSAYGFEVMETSKTWDWAVVAGSLRRCLKSMLATRSWRGSSFDPSHWGRGSYCSLHMETYVVLAISKPAVRSAIQEEVDDDIFIRGIVKRYVNHNAISCAGAFSEACKNRSLDLHETHVDQSWRKSMFENKAGMILRHGT